jgi:hypothetical protein
LGLGVNLLKRILPILLVFILLGLSLIVGYLYWKQYQQTKLPEGQTGSEIQTVKPQVGDPIKKIVSNEQDSLAYELEGTFDEIPQKREVLLYAKLILNNDPLQRKIPIYIGASNGEVYLGTYKDSFGGDRSWRLVPGEQAIAFLKSGEPVIIKVQYFLSGNEAGDRIIRGHEAVLDALIKEFQEEKFEMQLPAEFVLSSDRIGVIR